MASGPVVIDTQWAGSVDMETQYSGSLIRVSWNFSDEQTTVDRHFWRLVSKPYTRNPIPVMKAGAQPDSTVTKIKLSDGEEYYALVTACNAASLCAQQRSQLVLFDSSPPIDGYFAVDSSEAARLNRTVPGGMTWRNRRVRGYAEINIAFLGFSDPHSGISRYWASVGSGFSLDDLQVTTALEASPANDNNSTHTARLQLNRLLNLNEIIYISLWAENGVGLRSHVIQGSFSVDDVPSRTNNGTLTILRSYNCPIDSCLGHCTCAARSDLCTINVNPTSACQVQDLSMLNTDMQLRVSIISPQQMSGSQAAPLFTASTDMLIGHWELIDPASTAVQRAEWSFSEEGYSPGVGLMDGINDFVWHQADDSNTAIFSISPSYPLRHGIGYVFHVRAWYSNVSYAVFTSEGVTMDTVFPSVVMGARVRDVLVGGSSEDDLDYTFNDDEVEISWQYVFIQSLSGSYSTYEVAIGDSPGADNVYPFSLVSDPSLNHSLISGLSLMHGRIYYSTVRVTNPLGIREVSVSDGFTVDLSPPSPGVVLDGEGMSYMDAVAQFDRRSYSGRWFGFSDPESGIHHYEVAFTDSPDQPSVDEYTDVGISLREMMPVATLTHSGTYYVHIVVENNAGLRSHDVVSNGVAVDYVDRLRRPVARQRVPLTETNLLLNPSFEPSTAVTTSCHGVKDSSIDDITRNWTLSTILSRMVTTSAGLVPYDGCSALLFSGSISQSVPTLPGVEYELSFALKRNTSLKLAQAVVTFPGHSRTITLSSQKQSKSDGWMKYRFIFNAQGLTDTSEISLSTVDDSYAILVDGFGLTALNSSSTEMTAPSRDIVVTWSDVIHVSHTPIAHSWTQLYVSWDIIDPESGVREYLWAIGTVPGGEQLQSYTSTGGERQGVSGWLSLHHGDEVYISVVAWNQAGLERVVYSTRHLVDLTPPTLLGEVYDGGDPSSDVDFQSNPSQVGVVFSACQDRESGLKEIRWALGKCTYVDIKK